MSQQQNLDIKRGEIIVLSYGEYSDYRVNAIMVCMQDCNLKEMAEKYTAEEMAKRPKHDRYWSWSDIVESFPSWLSAQQIMTPVQQREIYYGSYGEFDKDIGVPNNG